MTLCNLITRKQFILQLKIKAMLQQSINFFKQTEKAEIKNIPETRLQNKTNFENAGSKIFTAVDLWNIQRRAKAIMPRRSFF